MLSDSAARRASEVIAAREFRAALTRKLQDAQDESSGTLLYEVAIKSEIQEACPGWSSDQWRELLSQLTSGNMKPSAVAARIAAEKFDLPLREVRSGRPSQPIPRRRGRVHVSCDDRIEHALEQERQGRTRSRANADGEEGQPAAFHGHRRRSRRR